MIKAMVQPICAGVTDVVSRSVLGEHKPFLLALGRNKHRKNKKNQLKKTTGYKNLLFSH